MLIRVLVIANIVVFGFIGLCIPFMDNGWHYEGVGPAEDDAILRPSGGPAFILENDRLYLHRANETRAIILVTGIQPIEWSEEDIRELRRKHPKIDRDELWKSPDDG